MTSTALTPTDALQKALAGEHAAVYVYGVLGAQSSQSRNPDLFERLVDGYQQHRAARDDLMALVSAKGVDPAAAEVSYALPGPTANPEQIVATALLVEERLTTLYGELVSHTSGSDRSHAIRALDETSLRELAFGGRPSNLPGLS